MRTEETDEYLDRASFNFPLVLAALASILTPVFCLVRPVEVMWTVAALVVAFCSAPLFWGIGKLFDSDNTDILRPAEDATGHATPRADMLREMIGRVGTTVTLLRPGGQVRVDNRIVCALAESGVIRKDTPVVVVDADSMNLIVREADADTDATEQSD